MTYACIFICSCVNYRNDMASDATRYRQPMQSHYHKCGMVMPTVACSESGDIVMYSL